MKRHAESHLDHDLTTEQVAYLFERFADRNAFFIETLELPPELGTVPCFLYGPTMGDQPVPESEVHYYARGVRTYQTRSIYKDSRPTRKVTVIAGPHEEKCDRCDGQGSCQSLEIPGPGGPSFYTCSKCVGTGKLQNVCILYTAFGGPQAPQEPGDLKAQKNAIESQRLGLSDLTDEHKALTVKRDALREKLAASRTFWSEHALGCSPMGKLG